MKVKQLQTSVVINTKPFQGTYVWGGGTSYYLKGSDIHFSVSHNGEVEFTSFHITPDVLTGTNVGIWFNGATWSNNNLRNLPTSKQAVWEKWWKDNQTAVKAAGAEFWVNAQA